MSSINDVPIDLVTPVILKKDAVAEACGLLFPHGKHLSLGLVVDWEGTTRLIHLVGECAFSEGSIDIGQHIRGVVINAIEYQVDLASCYNALNEADPAGALVIQGGKLYLSCRRLGDAFHNEPRLVPLGKDCPPGGADESCGFTRWSIGIRVDGKLKVLESFEATKSTE